MISINKYALHTYICTHYNSRETRWCIEKTPKGRSGMISINRYALDIYIYIDCKYVSCIYLNKYALRIYIYTYCEYALRIHRLYIYIIYISQALNEGGTAALDGRMLAGDVITHIQGRSVGHPPRMKDLVKMQSTLQRTATYCNILQHTATHCDTLQHAATHCNTLQHTATCCNTLQHAATRCITL